MGTLATFGKIAAFAGLGMLLALMLSRPEQHLVSAEGWAQELDYSRPTDFIRLMSPVPPDGRGSGLTVKLDERHCQKGGGSMVIFSFAHGRSGDAPGLMLCCEKETLLAQCWRLEK